MQVQRAMIGKETYTEWDDLGRVELPPDATAKAGAVILMEAVENKRKGAASDVVPWHESAIRRLDAPA